MSALLPLVGGLLLGRFVANTRIAIAAQAAFFAIAATVLIVTAPSHGASYTQGLLFALILVPLSAATLYLGAIWQRRTAGAAR